MAPFPTEVSTGLALGLLVGLAPAGLLCLAAFVAAQYSDRSVPRVVSAVVLLGAVLGVGFVLDLFSQTAIRPAMTGTTALVAITLGLFAHSVGADLADRWPRAASQPTRRHRALDPEALDAVDGMGQVTVRSAGAVRDLDEYRSLSPDLRSKLETGSWRFPADLSTQTIEDRLEDRLRTEHDLAAVSTSIDPRGRATIAAAPPERGVAGRVAPGQRAVTVSALHPPDLTAGDSVAVYTDWAVVDATVLSVDDHSSLWDGEVDSTANGVTERRPASDSIEATLREQLTVIVETERAAGLLESERCRIAVRPQDGGTALEALALLDRAGYLVRKVRVGDSLGTALDEYPALRVVAMREDDGGVRDWRFHPDPDELEPGQSALLIGPRASLDAAASDDPSSPTEVRS